MEKNGIVIRKPAKGAISSFAVSSGNGEYFLVAFCGDERLFYVSSDLRVWTKVDSLPSAASSDKVTSIVLDGDDGRCRLYLRDGGIAFAFSADGRNWMTYEWDEATLKDGGVVYEGDYLKGIPYHDYLHRMEIPQGDGVFDVRAFGAVPDGRTISTPAFKAAVEAIESRGSGTLVVAGGCYVVGQIEFTSDMTLFIDIDSSISASRNFDNYKEAFVSFQDCRNVVLTGGGSIVGNGEYFAYAPLRRPHLDRLPYIKLPPFLYDPMGYPVDTLRYSYRNAIRYAEDKYGEGLERIRRPLYNIWFNCCRNVRIENILVKASLDWTLSVDNSDEVLIKDIVIDGNRHVANTDGIDIMSSRNVEIRHCFVSSADDGICIKAPGSHAHDGIELEEEKELGPAEHIKVSDCFVSSCMNCFKIGTETYYPIRDVLVENCHFFLNDIFPGSISGINISSVDGTELEDVTVRNITIDGVCSPIFICLNRRNKFGVTEKNRFGGYIRRVLIENVEAVGMEVPCIVTGYYDGEVTRYLEDISIRNVQLRYQDDDERLDIRPHIHESITDYPESNAFGDVPAYGFFFRHVKGLELDNVHVIPRSVNTRPEMVFDDVEK